MSHSCIYCCRCVTAHCSSSRFSSVVADPRSTCSVVPAPSPLFNAVPACASWKDSSKIVSLGLVCQFQADASGAPAVFDGGNFSYGLMLGLPGNAGHFGLTVDPDIYLRVRKALHDEFLFHSILHDFPSTLPLSMLRPTPLI
jgi:hypothetical protein